MQLALQELVATAKQRFVGSGQLESSCRFLCDFVSILLQQEAFVMMQQLLAQILASSGHFLEYKGQEKLHASIWTHACELIQVRIKCTFWQNLYSPHIYRHAITMKLSFAMSSPNKL